MTAPAQAGPGEALSSQPQVPSDDAIRRGLKEFNAEPAFPAWADTSDTGRMRRAYAAIEAALSSQPTAPRELPLDFRPHLPGAQSAEPSLSSLIHHYYAIYFDRPRSTGYAEAYIAALLAPSKAEGASK